MNEHIERAAARWLVELDTHQRPEDLRPEFEAWLTERPEHRTAFEGMEQTWTALDDLRVFFIPGGPKLPRDQSRYGQIIGMIADVPNRLRARVDRIRRRWREWRIR